LKYIYFIERNGVKYYKLDTFWSESKDITSSKVYSSINLELLDSYTHTISYWFENNQDAYLKHYEEWNNAFLGYQTLEDDQTQPDNKYILVDKPIISDTTYIFTLNIYKDCTIVLRDYKIKNRENKLKIILEADKLGK